MDVSAKHEGNQLELALKGELDHHGAKGLLTCLEQEIQRSLPLVLVLTFPVSHLWTAPVLPWHCGAGSACVSWAAASPCAMWRSSPARCSRLPALAG